jgi:hypothetical protein
MDAPEQDAATHEVQEADVAVELHAAGSVVEASVADAIEIVTADEDEAMADPPRAEAGTVDVLSAISERTERSRPTTPTKSVDSVKSPTSERFGSAKSPTSERFGSAKSPMSQRFGSTKSDTSERFGSVKSATSGSTKHSSDRTLSDQPTERSTVDVLVTSEEGRTSTNVTLVSARSLSDQIAAVCEQVSAAERPAADYALLAPWRPEYVTAEQWLEGLPPWLFGGVTLELVPHPSVEVREVLEQLCESEEGGADEVREQREQLKTARQMTTLPDGRNLLLTCLLACWLTQVREQREQLKRRVFWMRDRLRIAAWAEEFVAQDGLPALLELMHTHDGGGGGVLQAYSLIALRQALCWQYTMVELCRSPENLHMLCRSDATHHRA